MNLSGHDNDAYQVSLATITYKSLWLQGIKIFKSGLAPALYLSLCGMSIPFIIFSIFAAIGAEREVIQFKGFTASLTSTQPVGFAEYFSFLLAYVEPVILPSLGLVLCFTATYFAYLYRMHQKLMGAPQLSHLEVIFKGLKASLRSTLVLASSGLLALLIAQVLIIPGLVLFILLMMAPIIMVWENTGIWRAIGRSIRLDFSQRKSPFQWNTFFHLIGYGIIGTVVFMGWSWIFRKIIWIDDFIDIPRFTQTFLIFGTPIKIFWFVISFVKSWVYGLTTLFMTNFLISLFCQVRFNPQPTSQKTTLNHPSTL